MPTSRGNRQSRGAHYNVPGKPEDVRINSRGNSPALPGRVWPQSIRPVVITPGNQRGPFAIETINYVSPNAKSTVSPDPSVPGDLPAIMHPLQENHTDTYLDPDAAFEDSDEDQVDTLSGLIDVPETNEIFYWGTGDAWYCRFPGGPATDNLKAFDSLLPLVKLEGIVHTGQTFVGASTPGGVGGMTLNSMVWYQFETIDWDPASLTWKNAPPSLGSTATIEFPEQGHDFQYYNEFGPDNIFYRMDFGGFSTGAAPATVITSADPRDNVNGTPAPGVWGNLLFTATNRPFINGLAMRTPAPSTTSVALAGWPWQYGPDGVGPFYASDPLYTQGIWNSQYSLPGGPLTGPFIGSRIQLYPYDDPDNPIERVVSGFDGSGDGGIFYIDPTQPAGPWPFAPRVGTKIMDLPASPTDSTPTPTLVIDESKTDRIVVTFVVYGVSIRIYNLCNGGFTTSVQAPPLSDPKAFKASFAVTNLKNMPNYPVKDVAEGQVPF